MTLQFCSFQITPKHPLIAPKQKYDTISAQSTSMKHTSVLLWSVAVLLHFVQSTTVVVTTKSGPIEGLVTNCCYEFKGIPYAMPPTGSVRFLPYHND
jgi:hypothetical protein